MSICGKNVKLFQDKSLYAFYPEITLYLQENCKDSTEFPYALHPAISNVIIFHDCGTFMKAKKLTLVQYTNYITDFI